MNMADEEWIELGSLLDNARYNYDYELYNEAIEQYLNILKSNLLDYSDRATVMAELGYCYYEIGDYTGAVDKLLLAKELDATFSNNSGYCRVLGNCYFNLGNYKEAIAFQKNGLKETAYEDEKSLILFQLGRSYLFSGDGKSAIKYFKKYLDLIPVDDIENRMDAIYNLGFAYIMLNKMKKAEQAFQFLIDRKRNSDDLARGYYGLTELYFHNNKMKNVIDYGQKVLNIDDQFSERETILFYLIMAFSKEGNAAQLTELADKFLKEFPNSKHSNKVKSLI